MAEPWSSVQGARGHEWHGLVTGTTALIVGDRPCLQAVRKKLHLLSVGLENSMSADTAIY
jgi:hypothetical protein